MPPKQLPAAKKTVTKAAPAGVSAAKQTRPTVVAAKSAGKSNAGSKG